MNFYIPKTFICGDPYFCDASAAQRNGMKLKEYQNKLIKNINDKVDEKDFIIFTGELGFEKEEDIEPIMKQIKGKISFLTEKKINNYNTYLIDLCSSGKTVNEQEIPVVYFSCKKNFKKCINNNSNVYIAAPESISEQTDMFKNRILNISINKWNFEPICMDDIPQIIDNYELFATMKAEEKTY